MAARLGATGAATAAGEERETAPDLIDRRAMDLPELILPAGTAEQRTTRVEPRAETRAPVKTAALEIPADITDAIVGLA